ncbi:mannitol-1-phosphate dehydrogenase M1PDH1 [Coniophora puteana RWD-64-598 SS2]|uniref:alcohol dehydrogenase n=1 Tax=Coniophora puteana (strain RWD-64-598) TaxID=741705 RepID=A0A5M3N359_CONPW|nr:mannitol-1-phosphate dehydrogenase M1PDH1 [Coniophora puteana RWD-64-598 SS2]EIW85839.1 mannitol-1-phosphate dehydrogenase M1PDH1 [Coniophora puteana RWD-64-598 SS2]
MSQIPATQRAVSVHAFGEPTKLSNDHPVPDPSSLGPNECLVKLETAGVCQSDLHARNGDWLLKPPRLPFIGGHEGVGKVVAIGKGALVEEGGVKVGDRVGLKWIATVCNKCEFCRKGNESSCPKRLTNGFSTDGTFCEYIRTWTDYVTPIPDVLSSAAATPLLCAGLTVYKGLKHANSLPGEWIAIPGAGGGLGHLAIQLARNMGLRVLAIDSGEDKRKLCMSLGAEQWLDFAETSNIVADVQRLTNGGPRTALVAAGGAKPYEQALIYLKPTGTLIAAGLGSDAVMQAPFMVWVGKELKLVGSALGSRQDAIEVLDLAAQGKVVAHYTTRKLEDVESIFTELAQGKVTGRVVLEI